MNEENKNDAPTPMGWRAYTVIAVLLAVMAGLVAIGWRIWNSIKVELDPFVWVMMGVALLIAIVLGGGLTFLLSYSSRHHDHKVYDANHFDKWNRR